MTTSPEERLSAAADRCEDIARRTAREGYFDPPMTEEEVVASAATHVELTDLRSLLSTLASLRAKNERLRGALEPFARLLPQVEERWGPDAEQSVIAYATGETTPEGGSLFHVVQVGDFRRAAAALEEGT